MYLWSVRDPPCRRFGCGYEAERVHSVWLSAEYIRSNDVEYSTNIQIQDLRIGPVRRRLKGSSPRRAGVGNENV